MSQIRDLKSYISILHLYIFVASSAIAVITIKAIIVLRLSLSSDYLSTLNIFFDHLELFKQH